jgi:hypothetical protein
VLASALPALLAASISAVEFEPDLLFDAARALPPDSADTQQAYIRISGSKNLAYAHTFLLEGTHNASVVPVKGFSAATVEGKLENGYRLHGEFHQSDGPGATNRSVLRIHSESDTLALGDLTFPEEHGPFYTPFRTRGVRFSKGTDIYGVDALVLTPMTDMRTEYLKGEGTQGPFTLRYTPVVEGSETITLIHGLTERNIQRSSYRINHHTGSLIFEDRLIHKNQLVKVSYQQIGSIRLRSIKSVKMRYSPVDPVSVTAQALSIADEDDEEDDRYTALGITSASSHVEADAMIVLTQQRERLCGAAASELSLRRNSGRFRFNLGYSSLGKKLAQLGGARSPQEKIESCGSIMLPWQSRLDMGYTRRKDETGHGALLRYAYSVALPRSFRASCEWTRGSHENGLRSHKKFVISKKATSHNVLASLSSACFNGDQVRCCSCFVEMRPIRDIEASMSSSYSATQASPVDYTLQCLLRGKLNNTATTTLSLDLSRLGGDVQRKVVHAELCTRRGAPLVLIGEYHLRCLNSESNEPHGYRQVHDLAVSAQAKLPGFSLAYHPRLSHSRKPELMQHHLVLHWALLRQFAVEASMDRAKHSPMNGHNTTHEREIIKAACRISPTSSARLSFEYRNGKRRSPPMQTSCLNRKWRGGLIATMGDRASIEVGFTDLLTAQSQRDSTAVPSRDRTIDFRGSRELSPGLLAYMEVGITRRDASATGYSRSPGAGLKFNSGGTMNAQISYRAVMWEGLLARDSENLALQANLAQTWLSSSCRVEYVSMTHPLSRFLGLSIEASLHF